MGPYRIYAMIGNDNSVTLRAEVTYEADAVRAADSLQVRLEVETGQATMFVLDARSRLVTTRP